MRFFQQQEVALKKSFYLLFLFALAVSTVALITAGASTAILFSTFHHTYKFQDPAFLITFKQIFFLTAGAISAASLIRIFFPPTGHSVARSLGGKLLKRDSKEPNERKLLNIVEEMSIASGVPMPPVYVLRHDKSINALAAGSDSFDAVIAVTDGAMTVLTRDELQGVIGHEFSHILHDDLRLNLRITATISGLMVIANLGRFLMDMRGDLSTSPFKMNRDEKKSSGLPTLGVALFAIGSLGVFFSRLIQSAISRQREYLADASSTQFTRNPLGLASALAKIQYFSGSSLISARSYEIDHYLFASGIGDGFFNSIFATHPPIKERIKEIYPQFSHKDFLSKLHNTNEVLEYFENLESHRQKYAASSMAEKKFPDESKIAYQSIANPTATHLGFAREVVADIPQEISSVALSVFSATNAIWAVALCFQEKITVQDLIAKSLISSNDANEIEASRQWLKTNLHTHSALLSLAIASLQVLPLYEKKKVTAKLNDLFLLDGDFSLLEMLLFIYVDKVLIPNKSSEKQSTSLANLANRSINHSFEKIIVWILNSFSEQQSNEHKKKLYLQVTSLLVHSPRSFESIEKLTFSDLQASLDVLSNINLLSKGKMIQVLFQIIDAKDIHQTETLRLLCGILKVPVPPILRHSKT